MSFNTYGARSKSLGMNLIPVWVKVDGVIRVGENSTLLQVLQANIRWVQ